MRVCVPILPPPTPHAKQQQQEEEGGEETLVADDFTQQGAFVGEGHALQLEHTVARESTTVVVPHRRPSSQRRQIAMEPVQLEKTNILLIGPTGWVRGAFTCTHTCLNACVYVCTDVEAVGAWATRLP